MAEYGSHRSWLRKHVVADISFCLLADAYHVRARRRKLASFH